MKTWVIYALAFVFLVPAEGKQKQGRSAEGSQAQKWEGKLIDAGRSNCGIEVVGAAPAGTCPVSVSTLSFGLLLPDGKLAKFDEGGNAKAIDALKKSKKGSKLVMDFWKSGKTSHQVRAKVAGTLTGDTLNVESVQVD